jgi:hypothetical protein
MLVGHGIVCAVPNGCESSMARVSPADACEAPVAAERDNISFHARVSLHARARALLLVHPGNVCRRAATCGADSKQAQSCDHHRFGKSAGRSHGSLSDLRRTRALKLTVTNRFGQLVVLSQYKEQNNQQKQ